MKKFETLGRSLSKAEQKMVMGGDDEKLESADGGGGGCACTTNDDCVTAKCGNRCSSFNGTNQCWWNNF